MNGVDFLPFCEIQGINEDNESATMQKENVFMKITVTDQASKWFQDEMGLSNGRGVRFYGKVYGKTPVHDGFSLALTPDDHPDKPYAIAQKDGVNYFVQEDDRWFFKGYDLVIDYDASADSPQYNYVENDEL